MLQGGSEDNGEIVQTGYATFGSDIEPKPPENEAEVLSTLQQLKTLQNKIVSSSDPVLTPDNSVLPSNSYPVADWCQDCGAESVGVSCCWLVALPLGRQQRQSDTRRPDAFLQVRPDWHVSRQSETAGRNNPQPARSEFEATFSAIF